MALSLAACGTGLFGRRPAIEPAAQPPAPPATWLAACHDPALLPEGRELSAGEAWAAVFGDRGLVSAWRCERARRACVARWYAERLWEGERAAVAACERQMQTGPPIS